jgi:hypothetical protein
MPEFTDEMREEAARLRALANSGLEGLSSHDRREALRHQERIEVERVIGKSKSTANIGQIAAQEADAHRIEQAKQVMRDAGYIEQPDGTWLPPEHQSERGARPHVKHPHAEHEEKPPRKMLKFRVISSEEKPPPQKIQVQVRTYSQTEYLEHQREQQRESNRQRETALDDKLAELKRREVQQDRQGQPIIDLDGEDTGNDC